MTSLERVLITLSHKEPDRVPIFLFPNLHGAKELGLSIKEYFSKPKNVVEGQIRLRNKYKYDCVTSFYYGALEIEAWGGDVVFYEDGPPNSAEPFIKNKNDILNLKPPDINNNSKLQQVLETTRMLKERIKDEAPIIGVVISPFSLPVMQMGFDKYIDLIYEERELFTRLTDINTEFCINWANAQIEAGATAICYFDPVSSTTIIPRDLFLLTGYEIAKKFINNIKSPAAMHLASGNCIPIIDDLVKIGVAMVGVSVLEDLKTIKKLCKNRLTIAGNLNGIEMRRWSKDDAERIVKQTIADAAIGGGFILSDNHGEIPYLVPDEVILAISEAAHKWGKYPLNWIKNNE